MALSLNDMLRVESEDSVLECEDGAIKLVTPQSPVSELDEESQFGGFEPANSVEERVPAIAREMVVSNTEDAESNEPTPVSAMSAGKDASVSRDPVSAYFRQMGRAAPLSREQELALAKRIEAAQQTMITGLCGIPMLVEQIARWAREIVEGRRHLADLVDPSMSSHGPHADGVEDGPQAEPTGPDLAYHCDSPKLQPDVPKRANPQPKPKEAALGNQDIGPIPAVAARLDIIVALASPKTACGRRSRPRSCSE